MLKDLKCIPCEGGTPPLSEARVNALLKEVPEWRLEDDGKIRRQLRFKDFAEAVAFINKVASLAEAEGHHPNICISYSKVDIALWTHAISGLSVNDFIMAAKIDAI